MDFNNVRKKLLKKVNLKCYIIICCFKILIVRP